MDIKKLYLEWLSKLVCTDRLHRYKDYKQLMLYLFNRKFYWLLELDEDRAVDGLDLRERFIDEYNERNVYSMSSYDAKELYSHLDDECSVLEMLIALSLRCEETIIGDPDLGDRTYIWFWSMLRNLDIDDMTDDRYNESCLDEIIDILLEREYEPNGEGGLFSLYNCRHDLREVEIWYQLCWYLDDLMKGE